MITYAHMCISEFQYVRAAERGTCSTRPVGHGQNYFELLATGRSRAVFFWQCHWLGLCGHGHADDAASASAVALLYMTPAGTNT